MKSKAALKKRQKKFRDGQAKKLDRIERTLNSIRNAFELQKKLESGTLSEREKKYLKDHFGINVK